MKRKRGVRRDKYPTEDMDEFLKNAAAHLPPVHETGERAQLPMPATALEGAGEKKARLLMLAIALEGAGIGYTLGEWYTSSSAKDEVKRATIALLRLIHRAEMQNKTSVDESIDELSRLAGGKGKLHSKYVKKALKDIPLAKGTEVTMRKDRIFVTRKPDAETLAQLLSRLSKKYLRRMQPWIGGAK